jgi:hypothetical protein
MISRIVLVVGLIGCSDDGDIRDTVRASDSAPASLAPVPNPSRADSVGSTTGSRPPTAPDSIPPLSSEGWGTLRIGMTRAQVIAGAGSDANPNAVGGPDPASCDQFRPTRAPRGMLVMIEHDSLTRISLSAGSGIATSDGFEVGDSSSAVVRHYGARAVVTPHEYQSAPARYVTIWTRGRPPASSARGIVYEIGSDDRILRVHAGGPSIQYVEGCL